MAAQYGDEQVLIWRRAYAIAPNPLALDDTRHPKFDPRYAKLTPEQRKKLRDERARPIWDELRKWLDAKRGHAPPQTLVGQAMTQAGLRSAGGSNSS